MTPNIFVSRYVHNCRKAKCYYAAMIALQKVYKQVERKLKVEFKTHALE